MAYRVVNPAAGDAYFDNAGSAAEINTANVDGGNARGIGADRQDLNNVEHGADAFIRRNNIPSSGVDGSEKAIEAGTFAQQTAGQYLIMRDTDQLAGGVANTTLKSGGAEFVSPQDSIHKTEHGRIRRVTTSIRNGDWVAFSGAFRTVPTTADDGINDNAGSAVTDGTADDEANVTRAAPGEFIYRTGSPTPTQANYSAKNT